MHRNVHVALLLLVASTSAAAHTRTPSGSPPLAGYTQAWSSHNVVRIASHFTEDAVYEDVTLGEIHRGKAAIREFAESTFAALPGFALAQRSLTVGDRGAVLEWVMTGTYRSSGKRFKKLRADGVVRYAILTR